MFTGGLSLGLGTLIGAVVGALVGTGFGGLFWLDDQDKLRCGDDVLILIARRQVGLTRELLKRGHAGVTSIEVTEPEKIELHGFDRLPLSLRRAREQTEWSILQRTDGRRPDDPARDEAGEQLANLLKPTFHS